jgi:hypothetical protein
MGVLVPASDDRETDENPEAHRPGGGSAGGLFLAPMVGLAAAGYGLGSLFGAAVAFGIVGLFAGLMAGFALVLARYRDL